MTKALVAVADVTYGGVYYCDAFTTTGAQPLWVKLTTTGLPNLVPYSFRVDYNDPVGVQYLSFSYPVAGHENYDLYCRNGGNWSKIMDTTIAAAAVGDTIVRVTSLWTDPTAAIGTVYTLATHTVGFATVDNYILKSTDYGTTWSVVGNKYTRGEFGLYLNVIGNVIWYGCADTLPAIGQICGSLDAGITWDNEITTVGYTYIHITIDNKTPTHAYINNPGAGIELVTIAPPATISRFAYGGTAEPSHTVDHLFTDPDNAGYAVINVNGNIYYTVDSFDSETQTVLTGGDASAANHAITNFWNEGTTDLVMAGALGSIYHLTSKTDTSLSNRSGPSPSTPPYTNSIPAVGVVCLYGIWAGEYPAGSGVFVYADEEGEISDIPDPDNLGIPMFGDRSSWRDYDADSDGLVPTSTALSHYHAQDIQEANPQRHNPWPAASGAAPVSNGSEYVATDIATQTELDTHAALATHHAAVTLDADAAVLLDLSTQEIGLDTQTANTVFAGPSSGVANEPTFRALVEADLPAEAVLESELITNVHQHTYQEDHTAECDGAATQFFTANQFEEDTTMVWLNGVLQRPDTDYTEDATLDAITFAVAPADVDILIIAYIVDLE